MAEPILSAEMLREMLVYYPRTGLFRWRINASSTARRGQRAGCLNAGGYLVIRIDGTNYYVHRLAWLYVYGKWPDLVLDHIDGSRTNNKITNLRDVSVAINTQNTKAPTRRNTSGFAGVSWDAKLKKWRATITAHGVRHWLGSYETAEEADAVRQEAKRYLHDRCLA